jgi:streptogramin lyase
LSKEDEVQKLWAFVLITLSVPSAVANSGAGIHGMVTDNAGNPVRGAMIKATDGGKTVTRFAHADGRYEIALPPGKYDLTVEAYGFNSKREKDKDPSQAGETNFTLTPGFSVARLTSAELQSLLPDNSQTRFIRGACTICHSFAYIQHKSGYTAQEWAAFIPTMTAGRLASPEFTPAGLNAVTQALEAYFGPDSPYLGPNADPPKPQQVAHAEPSDAVLNATFHEYVIPGGLTSMPHSILADQNGDAWFSGRLVARFEAGPEKFDEYPVRGSHTGVVGKDGLIWMTVPHLGLASVDPVTGKVATYRIADLKTPVGVGFQASIVGTHTPAVDREGNIWCSGSSVWKFDVKTKQYQEYKIPLPAAAPKNSVEHWDQVPGEASRMVAEGTFYDIRVDSKDQVWVSAFSMGELIRLNPVTGETKAFYAPDSPSIRGIEIDAQDNVWFASYDGNSLGKLDPKTGAFKLFHPPTRYAMPYGIVADRKTGDIWFADLNGNHITRFREKTAEFDEFPIPSSESTTRFIDLDNKGRVWFTEWMNGKIGYLDPGPASNQP